MKEIVTEKICYYALALCIFKPVTIEQAFDIIAPLPESKDEKDNKILALRAAGMTWFEIGNAVGMHWNAVAHRARRYKERLINESR